MVFRKSGPSIVGRAAQTAARTALITATATTVAGKMAPKGQPAAPAEPAPAAPVQAQAAPVAQAGGLSDEAIAKLGKLAELRAAGVLTDAEFEVQKARLLA